MKRFLLIAGSSYYPDSGTGDWIGLYETRDEAYLVFLNTRHGLFARYDWYQIVDLQEVLETGVIPTSR